MMYWVILWIMTFLTTGSWPPPGTQDPFSPIVIFTFDTGSPVEAVVPPPTMKVGQSTRALKK